MVEAKVKEILEQLKSGDIEEITIEKQEFLSFREHLVKRDDFKHYFGIAERGGDVTYRYLKEPRS
ncbi:hypothetical protein [Niallia sp. 03190]|uniref:hypothetical protein n=1 Tax=Niallia sp. 03190 TaxID=3458061 RepID=UPI004043CCC6